MTREIDKIKKELRKYLYTNDIEINNIDKISFQKTLFTLLRECIKQKEYEVEIGSYIINVNPEETMVEYENEETSIRITKNDVYYETNRETEIRYFIPTYLSNQSDTFEPESPVIKVSGLVTNIDGDCEERYCFELFNTDEDIKTYLEIPSNIQISPYTEPTKYSIILTKSVSVKDQRLDVFKIFKENKVIPVIYNPKLDKYLKTSSIKEYSPSDYTTLLPNLDNRKNIVSFIYSSIVEFYDNYLKNNS